jgi:hypothetical protein
MKKQTDGCIIYTSIFDCFKQNISFEDAGKLFFAINEYHDIGKQTCIKDNETNLINIFNFYKRQLDIDNKKYAEKVNNSYRLAGLISGIKRSKEYKALETEEEKKQYLNERLNELTNVKNVEQTLNDVERNEQTLNNINECSTNVEQNEQTLNAQIVSERKLTNKDKDKDNVKDNVKDKDNESVKEKAQTRSPSINDSNDYSYAYQDLEAYYEAMRYFFPNFNEKYAVNKNRGWSLEKWKRQMQAWEIDFQKDNRSALVSQNRQQTKSEQIKQTMMNAFPEVFEGAGNEENTKEVKDLNVMDDFINNGETGNA